MLQLLSRVKLTCPRREIGRLGSHTSATSRHEARRARSRQAGWTTAAADSPLPSYGHYHLQAASR
eukprot:scaffold46961_cov81-Phaeocystis_antarctica.AAC.8